MRQVLTRIQLKKKTFKITLFGNSYKSCEFFDKRPQDFLNNRIFLTYMIVDFDRFGHYNQMSVIRYNILSEFDIFF